jgi:acyl carrier protein phosphodiesterase
MMNYLAHVFLSGDNEDVLIGNFIADHVKGKAILDFSDNIRAGIVLHREIDRFTDSHPQFLKSKKRLANNYRKYSGVIVDMFYDHFLAANWSDYTDESLEKFTQRVYRALMKKYLILPRKTKYILPFMAKSNWLMNYGSFEGLHRALSGMAKRTPYESGMEKATEDLKKDYGLYKGEFYAFFPEVISFSKKRIGEIIMEA